MSSISEFTDSVWAFRYGCREQTKGLVVTARRSGFNVSLRRVNSSGLGKMMPAGANAKKQVNTRKRPMCGAKPGQNCSSSLLTSLAPRQPKQRPAA